MPPNKRASGLPYRDDEILRADDPKPQRVPQYPTTGVRRAVKRPAEEAIPTSVFDTEKHDEELRASYGAAEAFTPAFLYVERGPGQGQLMEVKQGAVVVGRASVADLRLQHPSISRRHAQVRRVGEQFWVKDLGSQNGTFVNKQRIAAEVEVRPGDLLAIGNALLKLRGPLQKNELPQTPVLQAKAPQPSRVSKAAKPLQTSVVKRPGSTSNAVKIAIFAGAVGFGIALVLAVALLKRDSGPTFNALAEKGAARPTADAPEPEISSGEAVVKEQRIQDALTRKMQEKRAQASAAPAVAAAVDFVFVVEEVPTAVTTDRKAATATRPTVLAAASRPAAKKAAEEDEDEEADTNTPAGGGKRAALLAAYEKGNATTSLEAAKKAGDKELVGKLTAFLEAYEAAGDAVVSNQGSAAIRSFEKALKLDEELSSGWSKYGGEIRKQLANLYTLVGLQHAANDNPDNAKLAFKAALKFDPTNSRAKAQLSKLSGETAAASDEDEAPAPKKKAAPAKKSKAQAIDDAFGD